MRKIISLTTMLIFISILAISQSRVISGRIVDETGQPVSGASITILGSKAGASAGADGGFKINAKPGDVLQISAVNFGNTQTKIGNQTSVAVTLNSSSSKLSEVIVTTALGIQRQAKSLGYSTAKVSSTDLVQAKPVNVVNGLTGKVSVLPVLH